MLLPNQLTTLRIILTPFFVYFFLSDNPVYRQISLAIFLVAAITDWYDGWLARKFNYITAYGKFMDPLADKILTSAAFFSLVSLGILELWMVVIIVIRDFLITGLRGYAEYKGKTMTTSVVVKWKTAFQMVFLYYLLFLYVGKSVSWLYNSYENIFILMLNPVFIYYSMLFISLFTLVTGLQYLYKNRHLYHQLLR